MGAFGIILLAVSLSIDALGIGVSYGLRSIKIPLSAKLIVSIVSILFTGCAVLIGNVILMWLPKTAAQLIGCLMLFILGVFIILQALFSKKKQKKEKPKKDTIFSAPLKPFGITIQVIRNPVSCDFDHSAHIDAFEAIYLGAALSIDSFGAGISSAVSGLNSLFIPIVAGLCQLLFLCAGNMIGQRISSFQKIDSKIFVVCSGILLIILALIRFFCCYPF
mgnify:CR=1 FL=1